jgi:hypothetical protein
VASFFWINTFKIATDDIGKSVGETLRGINSPGVLPSRAYKTSEDRAMISLLIIQELLLPLIQLIQRFNG